MHRPSTRSRPYGSSAEPVAQVDNGSGLFNACKAHFASPKYEVECDAMHTVWVKNTEGTRSLGLSQWLLRQHSMDELLERVETGLATARPRGD